HERMAKRPRPALVVEMQELRLQFRQVYIARTFRLAGLAQEAQVEHVVDPAAPQLLERLFAGQRQAQGIGPATRAVLLVARRPERRAHGPALQLAASARAVAHLDRAHESFL